MLLQLKMVILASKVQSYATTVPWCHLSTFFVRVRDEFNYHRPRSRELFLFFAFVVQPNVLQGHVSPQVSMVIMFEYFLKPAVSDVT